MRVRRCACLSALAVALSWAALALAAPSARADVLYVGDSLGVGTAPYLRQELGGERLDVDAKVSRPSSTGVIVLASLIDPTYDVVVFDLGTNDDGSDPGSYLADLARARELAGDRCLVVATLNRPALNGVSVGPLNHVVTNFAASDRNAALVDWHAAAEADPSLLVDGVHSTARGYALRARLFADAIRSCSDSATTVGPQDLEHEDGGLPPDTTVENTERRAPGPRSPSRHQSPTERAVALLAVTAGRAVGTGADFG